MNARQPVNGKPAFQRTGPTGLQLGLSLATLAIATLLLLMPLENQFSFRSLGVLWDLGHVPLFALLTYTALNLAGSNRSLPALLLIAVTLAGFGIATEALQQDLGRESSARDFGLDLSGIGLGLTAWLYRQQRSPLWIKSCGLITLGILAALCRDPILIWRDDWAARQSFPVLVNFTSPLQVSRFASTGNLVLEKDRQRPYGRLRLDTGTYSGFQLLHFNRNWSKHQQLLISLHNPQQPFAISCRIHDRAHNQKYSDRYNQVFFLQPGENLLQIDLDRVRTAPLGREMDLKRIQALGCFVTRAREHRVLHLLQIELV